jgi:hypothetical protein
VALLEGLQHKGLLIEGRFSLARHGQQYEILNIAEGRIGRGDDDGGVLGVASSGPSRILAFCRAVIGASW